MQKIKTKNLYLRELLLNDITSEYINSLNDSEVVGLTEARHRKWSRKNVRKYVIESNKKGVSKLIGIFIKKTGKHIGNIHLFNFNKIHKRLELGIMIYDKSQWSKGYGTESLIAIENYVFNILKYHKICADYYSTNIASSRMFKKAGFVIEGIFKDHFFHNNKYVDSVRIAKFNSKSSFNK